MKRLMVSWVSAELLEKIGLWLIIVGLIGEAALVFSWFETNSEKSLTFIFTVTIAAGVWIENVGASDISSKKDALIAEANERSADAELRAATASREAGIARKGAASAELRLEKFRRSLTPPRQRR